MANNKFGPLAKFNECTTAKGFFYARLRGIT